MSNTHDEHDQMTVVAPSVPFTVESAQNTMSQHRVAALQLLQTHGGLDLEVNVQRMEQTRHGYWPVGTFGTNVASMAEMYQSDPAEAERLFCHGVEEECTSLRLCREDRMMIDDNFAGLVRKGSFEDIGEYRMARSRMDEHLHHLDEGYDRFRMNLLDNVKANEGVVSLDHRALSGLAGLNHDGRVTAVLGFDPQSRLMAQHEAETSRQAAQPNRFVALLNGEAPAPDGPPAQVVPSTQEMFAALGVDQDREVHRGLPQASVSGNSMMSVLNAQVSAPVSRIDPKTDPRFNQPEGPEGPDGSDPQFG